MPLYEYECDACGQRFEVIQKFSDALVAVCTMCGKGPVHKLLSSPAIQFKGSGWYITDYSQKGKSESTKTDSGESKKESKSDATTESKPASKTDTPSTTSTSSTTKS
jgi:putative FmdB family regulatory protein